MPPRPHLVKPYRRPSFGRGGLLIALSIVAAVVLIAMAVRDYAAISTVTLDVESKESVSTDSGHEYRVYTDKGTFVIKDSFVRPQFNSADIYGRLRPGTYRCEQFGWRVPLLSMFKHIRKCAVPA